MDINELIKISESAQKFSYSPYSHITVGAALLTKSGKVYTGANIENASYGATICAERTAFVKALSEGEHDFEAIAITSSLNHETAPCGICRQFMDEFVKDDFKIILVNKEGEPSVRPFSYFMPDSFRIEN